MTRWRIAGAIALALFITGAARLAARDRALEDRIFGSTPLLSVRGISSAGAPWVAKNSRVRLEADGSVRVRIRGLVLGAGLTAAGTPVAPALVGTNPVGSVRIAVTWAVPTSVSPTAVAVQETPTLALDASGDLEARTSVGGPPPPGADRPIILVRIANAAGVSGAFIALSDFPAELGSAGHDED